MRILILLIAATCAYAQTQSSGITALGGSTIDLSAATATKTLKIATSDPATCVVGEMLFRSDLTAGSNIKGCTSTNTWTLQAGGSGATISGTDAAVVTKTGSNGVTRTLPCFTNDGTSLVHDGTCFSELAGDNTHTGINDFSGATSQRMKFGTAAAASGDCDASGEEGNFYLQSQNGATANSQAYICARIGASTYGWRPLGHFVDDTAPATCLTGQVWFDSNATAGSNWYGCTAANTWTVMGSTGTPTSIGAQKGINYCAAPAASTSSTTLTDLATIPLTGLATGDMVRLSARMSHGGGTSVAPRYAMLFGASIITPGAEVAWAAATDTDMALFAVIRIAGSSSEYTEASALRATNGTWSLGISMQTISVNVSGSVDLKIQGRMSSATAETAIIQHYCVEVIKGQ